jgi:X-Pro dipeptidyl-peptidase
VPLTTLIRSAVIASCGVAALAVLPSAAAAQTGGCSSYGESRTTTKGPFAARPDEVVELQSEIDGAVIQIGIVRPKAPEGHRAPVVALASTYQHVDYAQVDLAECQAWAVENFVPHGYAAAFISVRGTGNSGGCHNLLGPREQADISQAITYLGTRGWSNGRVGMYGLSYDAATIWSAAATGNPHLETLLPASGLPDLYDLTFGGGTYDFRWWLFVPGYYHLYGTIESNPAAGHAPDRWFEGFGRCPDLDAAYQATAESFATAERDSRGYWAERNHKPGVERGFRGSILLIQGLQDWNVRPAISIPWAPGLQRHGVEVKQLLGQWAHAMPDWEHAHMRRDFADLALRWFERHLKGRQDVDTGPAVEVQDTTGRWRGEDEWPPPNTKTYALGDDTSSEALLAPDSRSRHFFISEVAPLQTTDDWLPVPGAIEELCATCAAFSWDAGDGMRVSGMPEVRVQATPTGSTGHVAAVLYRRNGELGLKRIGWGMTDLRFPEGEGAYGEKPRPIVAGQPVDLTIRLEPMEAVVEKGEQLVLILGQGQSGQQPGQPPQPVRIALGANRASLSLALVAPSADRFFVPAGGGRADGGTRSGDSSGAGTGRGCSPSAGFRSVDVRPLPRGGGLLFGFTRRVSRPVTIDVFQTSVGRRTVMRRVALFTTDTRPLRWDGRARSGRALRDGYYFARFRVRQDDGRTDARRVTLRRHRGRFSVVRPHYGRVSCRLLVSAKLRAPVFGGRQRRPLRVAYVVTRNARVTVSVLRGSRRVVTITGRRRASKGTHRLTVPAAKLRRRGTYRVRISARRGKLVERTTLTARRL